MYIRKELLNIRKSKDIRLAVVELQKKGELCGYHQGMISAAIGIFYRIACSLFKQGKVQKFDSLGALLIGLLNISEKLSGSPRRISKIIADMHIIAGYQFDNEAVTKISVGNTRIIYFQHAQKNLYKEACAQALLQTEVVICSLLQFDFLFMDMHEILWTTLKKKGYLQEQINLAWIILTDTLAHPFLEYFSPEIILKTVERIAIKLTGGQPLKEKGEPLEVNILEEEILYIYTSNCRKYERIKSTENTPDLEKVDANEARVCNRLSTV
ncbi:uncharacterized protein NESG_02105 [Nematocida ausubeli]|uniref:Uncharacterized protein n=1 Tax=Nematocida ausubeli (strain ATCC PRA-371 / ERTm2) TaxID=1913371 RepID=A0A086IZL5_NEMA1|nr:uncharacterized protein NESG_02105 [Nematocida ausubeli]KAI5133971.1 hypothetical protein NEAUS06_0838 [Nematocida ausubeli]KAI5135826.1 hypothetical protein NEAUS07_1359 [Nematocida ausubeli]KFG25333.1 hypothetical protein NESG_02105 [Nematocida ausubeli]